MKTCENERKKMRFLTRSALFVVRRSEEIQSSKFKVQNRGSPSGESSLRPYSLAKSYNWRFKI